MCKWPRNKRNEIKVSQKIRFNSWQFQDIFFLLNEKSLVVMRRSDLDNLVGARGQQGSRRGLIVHVNNTVLAVVEGCRGSSAATDKQDGGCFLPWAADRAESRRVSVTHSSSVMDSWQLSHTRTSNSKPIRGMVERLDEHLPHTACPHFLQWCWGTQLHVHKHKDVPLLLTGSYLLPHRVCFLIAENWEAPVSNQSSCCPTSAWNSRRKAAHTSGRSHCPAILASEKCILKKFQPFRFSELRPKRTKTF